MNSINERFEKTFVPKNGIATITSGVVDAFYASTGAGAENKDNFSKKFKEACDNSITNSPFIEIQSLDPNSHRGPRGWTLKDGLRFKSDDLLHTLAPDGIGTKTILHDTLGLHGNGTDDMVAMTADDIARYGGVPTLLTSVLELPSLKKNGEEVQEYHQLISRLSEIAKSQNFVILNGETAETGACVGSTISFNARPFNRSGVMYGLYHKDLTILNKNIEPGDLLVVLKQDGFRSNGISAVRKGFELQYGSNRYKDAPKEEIIEAATPSVIYANAVAHANGWYNNGEKQVNIKGIAHLSGGSFKGKLLEDMLGKNNLSAKLDNLYEIPEIAKKVALWTKNDPDRGMKDVSEMYATRCCGQGMVLAVENEEEADKLINLMKVHGIDAQTAGRVIPTEEGQKPSIYIENIR